MTTFRDGIVKFLVGWLRGHFGSRYVYSAAIQLDGLGDAIVEGMRAQLPGEGTPEALPFIGRDRRIVRGFVEQEGSYVGRLRLWLQDWRTAGNVFALCRQMQGYLSPFGVTIRTVSNEGEWHTLAPDGSVSHHRSLPNNWDWDSGIISEAWRRSRWSRVWIVLYPPEALWQEGPTWGDDDQWGGAWGSPDCTWGSTAPRDVVRDLQGIIAAWKSATSRVVSVIVAFDPASFNPASSGAGMPNGLWGRWGADGLPVRLDTARYWDGES